MSSNGRNSQALAFVNALQTILDSLTDETANDEPLELASVPTPDEKLENTYELYIDASSKKSLSSLMICITLVCALHAPDAKKEP